MAYCSNCGAQNRDGANYCANCGAVLTTAPSQEAPDVPAQELRRGSKVTFTAADGNVYTGTVKRVSGDRYRVKYDGYNSETWLYRDQVNPGPGAQAIAVPVNDPNLNYSRAYTTVPVSRTRRSTLVLPALLGSLMILAGFFTNWLNYKYGEVTGWTMLTSAGDVVRSPDRNYVNVLLLGALVLIALSAIVCLLYSLGVPMRASAFSLFKVLPLLIIVGFVAYVIVKATNNAGEFELPVDSSALRILGIGSYLTLIGSLILAMSGSRKSLP